MISLRSQRKENFECEQCAHKNVGDGFTNHCSECLTSKHVDIFPGDRKETCGGLMPVTKVEKKGERYVLTHTCNSCQQVVGDHFRDGDNFDTLIKLVHQANTKQALKS